MRKSTESPRFPQSASLFKFCLRAMEVRRQSKVHDQEVGNILDYNPSDTSHWKRGKKAVKSIYALDALSHHLNVNPELVQDLADGLIDIDEAWYEFEEAEELKIANQSLTAELKQERRKRLLRSEQVCAQLLTKANTHSIPIFLPEVVSALPFISIVQGEVAEKIARSSRGKPGQFLIRYRKGDMKAHTRAAIAREIARIVMFSEREPLGLYEPNPQIEFLEMLDFSNSLLVPREQLIQETESLSSRVDLVKALSEAFWVPKSVIRTRIKQIALDNLNDTELAAPAVQVRDILGGQSQRMLDIRPTHELANTTGPGSVGPVSSPQTATSGPAESSSGGEPLKDALYRTSPIRE